MLQIILCILHVEIKIDLKILSLLFYNRLSNIKGSILPSTINVNGEYERENIFKNSINVLFNNHVLDDSTNKY